MKRVQLQLSIASLAVTTISAIYQALHVAPNQIRHLDNIDKKIDVLYSRNGMVILRRPNDYE